MTVRLVVAFLTTPLNSIAVVVCRIVARSTNLLLFLIAQGHQLRLTVPTVILLAFILVLVALVAILWRS